MLDTAAEAFDQLAEEDGHKVVAMVFAFVSETGGVRTGYHTLREIQDRNNLYISRAATAINADLIEWDKPHG